MINATEYRAMAAEHHRLAGMCRSPESREQHFRLEQELRALAEREEVLQGTRTPHDPGLGYGAAQRLGPARAQQETDPLGRPLRGRDYGDDTTVKVPGEIDVQRARRILEELRRRFGENFRPQLELEYIEWLLRDY